ncbi:hypothetical protein WH47_12002 [Habropoda laboriosa]|uniref:Histone-lysine N-methyltransferase SETMAR n=1 Tax=Habropoda laboriosa TaxID=597456 RepID=A0A0L7R111_9HYME|nr:hypothetical protein WH47_12002 [Habropoda laboriosa]
MGLDNRRPIRSQSAPLKSDTLRPLAGVMLNSLPKFSELTCSADCEEESPRGQSAKWTSTKDRETENYEHGSRHLFRALHFLLGKKFDNIDSTRSNIERYFNEEPKKFYNDRIMASSKSWEEVVDPVLPYSISRYV